MQNQTSTSLDTSYSCCGDSYGLAEFFLEPNMYECGSQSETTLSYVRLILELEKIRISII